MKNDNFEQSHSAEKSERGEVKNTQIAKVGILSCFQGSERRFYNFEWGSRFSVFGTFWSN